MAESENKALNEEMLIKCAYAAGFDMAHAMAATVDAFARGLYDGFAAQAAEVGGVELTRDPEDEEQPELKTEIRDCRACWCDTCGKLEDCTMHRDGEKPDGLRPLPCIGCVNGLRFRPKEKEPCADYIEGEGYNNG